jgi:iron complex transport system ATP-binding protein
MNAPSNLPLLECDGLTLRAGSRLLVERLSLQLEPAQRWVLIGPNGAGKSSLLGAMAGSRRPHGGEVRIEGRAVGAWSARELAARRALVNDRWFDPFAASVLDTVLTARYRFGAEAEDRDRALDALREMDCHELASHDVRGLSRGERQRAAIATALAQETPILLLDEPTSHQDPAHQSLVLRRLAAHADRAVVAVLHDVNAAARFATHALLLSGDGSWQAGPRHKILTAKALSALFMVPMRVTASGHGDVFWIDEEA